jgi:hypothetical protein
MPPVGLGAAIPVNVHVGAPTHGAKGDYETPVAEIGLGIPGQCQRCSWSACRRGMQRQACEASRSLAVHPCEAKVLRRDTPDGRCIAYMEIIDRAPDVRRCCAVVNEK